MGYTHYWEIKEDLNPKEWSKWISGAITIASKAEVPVDIDIKSTRKHRFMSIEGLGRYGYETLFIEPYQWDFNSCKTARKPYDKVVVAILQFGQQILPDKIRWWSDGNPEDHQDGLNLLIPSNELSNVSNEVSAALVAIGQKRKPHA